VATIAETTFAAIDFESAGARPGGTDVPVQIGIALLKGELIETGDFFGTHIHTDQPVTWSAQKVHGISNADLKDAPTLFSLWPEIKARLEGRPVVAHGASTERRFLRAFPLHGFGPWIDTLKVVRAYDPHLKSHALGDIAREYGLLSDVEALFPRFRWHDALCDAAASLVILRHIIRKCGIQSEPVELLLQPDDSLYHRLKAQSRHHRGGIA